MSFFGNGDEVVRRSKASFGNIFTSLELRGLKNRIVSDHNNDELAIFMA